MSKGKTETLVKTDRFPRKDVFFVPVTEVKEIKGSIEVGGKIFHENVRVDYGDIPLLAMQISENDGIRNPCKAIKKDGVYYLTDGHRRYRAALMILENTGVVINIPLMTEQHVTEEKRIMDMIICNEGKSLNPVEQADAIQRLIACGMDEKTIIAKTAFSSVYICNLKMLNKAPDKIKQMIVNNNIKATLAMSIMRKEKDYDKAIETIEQALDFKQSTENKTKITARDLSKAKNKVNSFSAIKKAYRHFEKKKLVVREDKVELFAFISRVMEGDVSFDELMGTLYLPEPEETKEPEFVDPNQTSIDVEQN